MHLELRKRRLARRELGCFYLSNQCGLRAYRVVRLEGEQPFEEPSSISLISMYEVRMNVV